MPQPEAENRERLEQLQNALDTGGDGRLAELAADVHPADLAEWMLELDEDERWRIFATLDDESRAELVQYVDDTIREELVERLSVRDLTQLVQEMPADEVVDLLALTDDHVTEDVLRRVDFERARGLRQLARHAEDTAGGLMTTAYPCVPTGTRVGDAIKAFKINDEQVVEDATGVFAIDEGGRPVGFLSGHVLLTSSIHDRVDEVMDTDLVTVSPDDDQEEVAHIAVKYGLPAVPVVDAKGVLVGVIDADDLQEVLEEEAEEDILKLVGTSPVEQTRLPVLVRVRQRIPLQLLTVGGGLLTAFILAQALDGGEGTHATAGLLRYLPIIIGIAGNVGIQSSTILVRAFATGEVQRDRELAVLRAEVLTGATIGVLCGGITMVLSSYMEGEATPDWAFGFAVGTAIAVAVTWAAFLGCTVPTVCRARGIDPAVVAGPFLITLSDVSGAAIFVGVAAFLRGVAA